MPSSSQSATNEGKNAIVETNVNDVIKKVYFVEDKMMPTQISMPDKMATRNTDQFHVNDEVLVLQNERFYFGVIKCIDNHILVEFSDGTEQWLQAAAITKLNITEHSMCVICKEYDDIVHVCAQCRRGFHKKCTKLSNINESTWYCNKCMITLNDTATQTNCYCGQKGEWYMQMLQCARCQQWFHAKCVKCLNFPLYFGDRFYLFACANCNHGVEFVRRLHMNMEEVVHLLLFNLSLQFGKRYYSLINVIFPYARDNWYTLQLPPKLKNMLLNDVKDEILKALKGNPERFRPGTELNKKVLNWALKLRSPPKAPNIVLPAGPPLTEKYINDLFNEQAPIYFLTHIHNPSDVTFNDAKIKDIMSGKNVALHINNSESSDGMDSGTFSSTSDDDLLANSIIREPLCIQTEANDKIKRKTSLAQCDKSNDTLDYYSSDDTFTLDAIIPPPKNFTGINNPFLFDGRKPKAANCENVPINKNVQIVRTVKRRLSATDIIIGPNMEVKRRKLKKRLENVEVISTSSLADLPKSAAYLPISADSKRISLSALRSTFKELPQKKAEMKKNDATNECNGDANDSIIDSISPIKDSLKEKSMADLKTSLNMYFGGVVNRFGNGEHFIIKGKRILSNGRIQYLVDWDGVS